jgi:orotate phosphoribosyltransferase
MDCIFKSKYFQTSPSGILIHRCSNPLVAQDTCANVAAEKHAHCPTCLFKKSAPPEIRIDKHLKYITTNQLIQDTLSLAKQIPHNCRGIIGIAKSGLLPATTLATHLQIPLYVLHLNNTEIIEIKSQPISSRGNTPLKPNNGPMLIIDDTVHDGNIISLVKNSINLSDVIYGAIYVTPHSMNHVDIYSKKLCTPHFLEWNLFNSGWILGNSYDQKFTGGIAFDFDGILCEDPSPGQDANDPASWIPFLKPTHMLPRRWAIPLIITMRLEKWRKLTIEWLEKYSIKYKHIEMCQADTVEERDSNFLDYLINHKAKKFGNSDCYMMIESDPYQSKTISEITKKPVLCPTDGIIYHTTE